MIKIDELVMVINKNDENKVKNLLKCGLFADAKIIENAT